MFASAFMSASEVAFFSLSPSDIKKLDKNNKSDRAIKQLLSNPQKLLATILTGNNFINIAIVILSAFTVNKLLNFGDHTILEFIFQTVIITFILLLFGEIIPKISATIMGVRLARRNAVLLLATEKILSPISSILVKSTVLIDKRLSKHQHKNISVEELETALKITATPKDKGTTDNEILQGIVNFGNINASQVMTSRMNMTSLDIATPFKKVLEVVIESGYSRLPVFSKSEDDIRGILYVKDLLPHLDKGDSFRWQTLIRNAYFVPETKKIDDLLTDFKKSRIHIAIVVDEFGGTSGVITMKDILEEIISN
ncbi:MAG: gliding motility-associated protein GldE, partial [Paludibacteraceae bacterium]|nr:gliding motility-associated protein GldE [Paludibacteraceae bacterium]